MSAEPPIAPNLIAVPDAAKDHLVKALLAQAKTLACEYYRITGKPLGVTGEVAEYEAAEKLGLTLADARSPYFDAFRDLLERRETFQIKGRAVAASNKYRGRVPSIKCDGEFDAVLLVLLDRQSLDTLEIWRASREAVRLRLEAPGSKARNERNSLGISQFRSIATRIWSRT